MDETDSGVERLRDQVVQVRVRAIAANRALIVELTGLWRELNELADGDPDARILREEVAADIARLEKVDLAFDTEWLAEAKRVPRR
ncbi:MAG: hypothetical protein QM779_01545 [Propionicimonas sp.]|uniref:hypothetical protein n=1 Tax=Propionicimonas sp. TaxID=1955623 RepID=UPI003D106BA5